MAHRRSGSAATIAIALMLIGCSGGAGPTATPAVTTSPAPQASPTSAPTPVPTAEPTPSAAPTTIPLPSPDVAAISAWAAEVCSINADYVTDNQQIATDIPEPTDRTLEALQAVNDQREPRVEQAYQAVIDRLAALTPYPGGEAFRLALVNEFQSQLDAMPAFFRAVADATSVDEIDAQYTTRGTVASAGLLGSARAVAAIDLPFADAIAAVTTGCRFFEFDARARPHGVATADFSQVVIDESFDSAGEWPTGTFDGGTASIANGSLTLTFDQGVTHVESTDGQPTSSFHDVRIESHFTIDGSALTGLSCRESDDQRYTVLVNPIGLILIYRTGDSPLMGRRAAPENFDASAGLDLAIECFAGNLDPFSLVVYLNGELVAEVQETHALESEGFAGMVAQGFSAGASATFDDFRVLVPAD